MTDQEKKDTLDNMLICYVDRTNLTNKQVEESEIFIEELREAINHTPCCMELKEKKAIPFEDWARVKGIKLLIDSNYRWDETYVYKEVVMKMYEVYLINL